MAGLMTLGVLVVLPSATDAQGGTADCQPSGGRGGDCLYFDDGPGGPGELPVSDGDLNCTVFGTEGDDVLRGTPERDFICGLGGDDVIFGFGGDDRIDGGDGDDRIYGGPGDDSLVAGQGTDVVYGGDGDDEIQGNLQFRDNGGSRDAGSDRLVGGPGDDVIAGGYFVGQGFFAGGGGEDGSVLVGGPGVDRMYGTDGDDRMYLGGGGGIAYGYNGDDVLVGAKPGPKLVTSSYCSPDTGFYERPFLPAVNVLNGGNGNDRLLSGGGASCLVAARGNDVIYGSDDGDVITLGGTGGIPDASGQRTTGGLLTDANRVYAKQGDDYVFGSYGSDTVYTNGGDDLFYGDADFNDPQIEVGDDRVELGTGNDFAEGSNGNDFFAGGEGEDYISGGQGDDRLWPGPDPDFSFLDGQEGSDVCGVGLETTVDNCEVIYRR